MEKETIEGYIAGIVFGMIGGVILLSAIHTNLSVTGNQITLFMGIIFGGLGIGSILKPDSVGQIASEWGARLARNASQGNGTIPGKNQEIKIEQHIGKVEGGMINQVGTSDSDATLGNAKKTPRRRKTTKTEK